MLKPIKGLKFEDNLELLDILTGYIMDYVESRKQP